MFLERLCRIVRETEILVDCMEGYSLTTGFPLHPGTSENSLSLGNLAEKVKLHGSFMNGLHMSKVNSEMCTDARCYNDNTTS